MMHVTENEGILAAAVIALLVLLALEPDEQPKPTIDCFSKADGTAYCFVDGRLERLRADKFKVVVEK